MLPHSIDRTVGDKLHERVHDIPRLPRPRVYVRFIKYDWDTAVRRKELWLRFVFEVSKERGLVRFVFEVNKERGLVGPRAYRRVWDRDIVRVWDRDIVCGGADRV